MLNCWSADSFITLLQFECIEEFFSQADWKEMSKYDKSAYLRQFQNYETLLELGMVQQNQLVNLCSLCKSFHFLIHLFTYFSARRTGKSLSTVKKPSFMTAKKNPSTKVYFSNF